MPGCAPPGVSREWSAGWRTATLDLELGDYIKRTIFNFEKHRRIDHYRLITERTGAKVEVQVQRSPEPNPSPLGVKG